MQSQSVINIGNNELSFVSTNIFEYAIEKDYLIKFEKDSCKSRIFRTTTTICGCIVNFKFVIINPIPFGQWKITILEKKNSPEDHLALLNNTIEVYKS